MKLTADEKQALAFIAALLLLSAAVRVAALPEPMPTPSSAGFDLDAHVEATERAVAGAERRAQPLGEGERLDPNAAPAEELDRLPGVGPALAERIVEARSGGRFRTARDLARVPGVGDRTAERLAPFLSLPAGEGGVSVSGGGGSISRSVARAAAGSSSAPSSSPQSEVLDLNRADAAALVSLPGVGPVLAERIVAHRDSAGPFLSVDSLRAVKGIGAATLDRMRSRVRVR